MTFVSPGSVTPVHCVRTFEQRFLESLPKWRLGDPPTQVVVPSESLRWHWVDALARSKRALLGVEVLTHPQWIRGVLRDAKLGCELRPAWVEHRAQVLAAKEPVLMRALGRYDDGLALASQAVIELIEAGFNPALAEPILEAALAWPRQPRLGVGGLVAPRVAALIRVAKKVSEEAAIAGGVMLPMAITKVIEIIKREGAAAPRPGAGARPRRAAAGASAAGGSLRPRASRRTRARLCASRSPRSRRVEGSNERNVV